MVISWYLMGELRTSYGRTPSTTAYDVYTHIHYKTGDQHLNILKFTTLHRLHLPLHDPGEFGQRTAKLKTHPTTELITETSWFHTRNHIS